MVSHFKRNLCFAFIQFERLNAVKASKTMTTNPMSVPKSAPVGRTLANRPHILRIMRDIREFYAENPDSMHVVADDNDLTTVHALIRGPEKTPYHNGFFYFVFR